MKAQEFIDLVNGLDLEEFSDIPEDKVKYIGSRFDEQWDIEETHSTAMNVYECDDGFVGCRGLCRCNESFDFRNTPWLNEYTHPWSDEMLYKYFNLTEDEIRIIEDEIK